MIQKNDNRPRPLTEQEIEDLRAETLKSSELMRERLKQSKLGKSIKLSRDNVTSHQTRFAPNEAPTTASGLKVNPTVE